MDDDYQRALDYLYGFINLEQKPADRYQASKIDATRPHRLLELLGAPQDRFPAIHIAGTKGKGSVAAMCAGCLRAAGLRVGLYTSPHLREFRERIRILTPDDDDGRITPAQFVELMDAVRNRLSEVEGITWFEIVTAIAFLHFARRAVDVAVVEVGLGGRLDATNVLTPLVSVITSLSLDHTQLLGDTLPQIAAEKGGIIKHGVPVVSAGQQPEAAQTLEQIAAERNAPLTVVGRDWRYEVHRRVAGSHTSQTLVITKSQAPDLVPPGSAFPLALDGKHQLENATVALAALSYIADRFPALTQAALTEGLSTVQWDGRLQVLQQGEDRPTILVDCAHNYDSAARLADALAHDYRYERLILIFGAPADKDVVSMMALLFPLADQVILTTANHPRSAAPEWLLEQSAQLGHEAIATHSVGEALALAMNLAGPGDLVCAAGSIIVIGDLLNHWDALQSAATHHG